MLASKRDKIRYSRLITSFDIASEELSALGEPECVERWCAREDGVRGNFSADLVDLLCEVSEKGSGAIRGWVRVKAHEVRVGAWVSTVDEGGDGAEAFSFVASIFSAVKRIRGGELTYLSPKPCQTMSGR